ncbi:MAG: acyclic terpene utilization AtuA family protein [Pseudomonadota bacterium]
MVKVLVPAGALGLGYDRSALERGIAAQPDIIAIDGGSTDSGPSYLGRGVSKYSESSTKAEWRELMQAREKAGVPLVIGTAGTCGVDACVDWMLNMTCEIAAELGQSIKIATLKSSQTASRVEDAWRSGSINSLDPAPELDDTAINACTNIVALAGTEQISAAIETGAEVIIAGRTTDTAIIAALPLTRGCHAGAAWHGAKIGECGALCTTNPLSGVIMISFDEDGFTVEPMAEVAVATPHTVSAHMLYENADPFRLYEPGGYLDVSEADYQAIENGAVRVTGSVWQTAQPYTVKLEGARLAGHQCMVLALVRDAHYVENAETWAQDIVEQCGAKVRARLGLPENEFSIEIRLIGKDAALGGLETAPHPAHELGAMGIVTAQSEATAVEIAKMLNPYLLHHTLTRNEEMPTFAFPFSPAEVNLGPKYEFCLNHVMELDDPMSAFELSVHEVSNG